MSRTLVVVGNRVARRSQGKLAGRWRRAMGRMQAAHSNYLARQLPDKSSPVAANCKCLSSVSSASQCLFVAVVDVGVVVSFGAATSSL